MTEKYSDELSKTILTTLITLFYLYENFYDKKDEFLLITNKSKRFLKNNSIDYKDIFSKLSININFS
jgi:hypothetical protein